MSAPSPTCLVNSLTTSGGVNVTAGATITIALASAAGVDTWSLTCTGTDDTNVAATVTAGLTPVTSSSKTFVAPAAGSALIFQSRVQGGVNANGQTVSAYTTTFGVYVLTSNSKRVLAVLETFEGNATFGWVAAVNAKLRDTGGGVPRRIAEDADTFLDYKFDEVSGSTSFASVGSTTTAFTVDSGTIIAGVMSPLDKATYSTGSTYLKGSTSAHPTVNACTFEVWFKCAVMAGGTSEIFGKKWDNTNSFNAPYASASIGVQDSSGRIRYTVCFGANGTTTTATEIETDAAFFISVYEWNHIGFTFDGATFKPYVNGRLATYTITSGPAVGSLIDFNTGSGGPWYAFGVPLSHSLPIAGFIEEARVWNVVKSAAWFEDVYRRFNNWNANTLSS